MVAEARAEFARTGEVRTQEQVRATIEEMRRTRVVEPVGRDGPRAQDAFALTTGTTRDAGLRRPRPSSTAVAGPREQRGLLDST